MNPVEQHFKEIDFINVLCKNNKGKDLHVFGNNNYMKSNEQQMEKQEESERIEREEDERVRDDIKYDEMKEEAFLDYSC